MKAKRLNPWLTAFALVALATIVRFALEPWLGSILPYATFNLAVAALAFYFGFGPALFASLLSMLAGTYFFLEPRFSFAIRGPREAVPAALSFSILLAISLLGYLVQRSRRTERESEERFLMMANAMPQLAWIAHADGFIYWYNRRWYEYTGTTPQQMEGWGWQSVHDPATLPKVLQHWKASIATGQAFEMVFPLRGADGKFRSFLTRVHPFKDRQGQVVQWLGTNTDVEELKRAEDNLRRQAALIDLSPDAIIVRDLEGRIKFWSKGAEKLYSWNHEEAIGRDTHFLLETEFPEPLEKIVGQLLDGRDWAGELRQKTKAGREVIVQSFWHGAQIDSEFELLESNVDITERKRTQETLQRSEENFRAVFEQAAVGIGRVRFSDGRWIDVNDAFCRMLGYSREEMKATAWPQVTHPEDVDSGMIPFRQLANGDLENCTLEKRYIHKLGHHVWARLTLSLVRDMLGRPDYELAVIEDITKRKHLEDELRAALTSAERANQAKDEFLAVLSHELRTPLTPVLAAVSLTQRRGDLPAQVHHHLEIIKRNVSVEARLIDDLLDLTRIVRGKVSLEKVEVNLCEVLARAAEVCKPDLEAKRLHFGMKFEQAPLPVIADLSRLQQVFWNLINNSVKFTVEGGCVGVRAFPESGNVIVEISDSGIGIEPDVLPKVFDAFEQGDRGITRQFGGLGLGLAITKRLVEMHDGRISAESGGRNKGATFRVTLLMAEQVKKKPEVEAEAERSPQAGLSRRILLVEDHADTAMMIKELLQVSGYEVETAADVAQALEATDHKDFDLVISDLGLPDRSGLELMQELRQRQKPLEGIALSGYGREEDVQRSKAAGFSEHLTKPVNLDTLLATVEKVIELTEVGRRS